MADSLTAVKKLVFDDKALSFGELLAALDGNFTGREGERVRQLCLNAPKYGNGDAETDALAKRVSDDSARIIRSYDNSPFRPLIIAREGLA